MTPRGLKEYKVTVKRTFKVQAENPPQAVNTVLEREQGPDDFTLSEIDTVEEIIWYRREGRVIERKDYA